MAHRTCAAALHAARMVLKFNSISVIPEDRLIFGVRPIGGLQATEAHLAIMIDRVTNAFAVAGLRPELLWWQIRLGEGGGDGVTAPKVAAFLNKVITTLEQVPDYKVTEASEARAVASVIPNGKSWDSFRLSKAAMEATKVIFQYYDVAPLNSEHVMPLEIHRIAVAKLIDVSLNLQKALKALPKLRECMTYLKNEQATLDDVRRWYRATGVILEAIPNYLDRKDEVKLLV